MERLREIRPEIERLRELEYEQNQLILRACEQNTHISIALTAGVSRSKVHRICRARNS